MTRLCKPREFDAAKDGNPFAWILEESQRQRHHNDRYLDEHRAAKAYVPPLAPGKSLRGFHKGHTVLLNDLQEPGANTARKDVFEIAKARKL